MNELQFKRFQLLDALFNFCLDGIVITDSIAWVLQVRAIAYVIYQAMHVNWPSLLG